LLLALLTATFPAARPIDSQVPNQQEKPMKHYALIFHTSRTLAPDEIQRRKGEIAAWVQRTTELGITLDARVLGETEANFSDQGGEVISHKESSDPTFTNIVFFDCSSKDQATEVARLHPGLHYGASVELREWTVPPSLR
jgi:hypothetical protein